MIALKKLLKPFFSISTLLAIMVNIYKEEEAKIQKTSNSLWSGFEILLFALVGKLTMSIMLF